MDVKVAQISSTPSCLSSTTLAAKSALQLSCIPVPQGKPIAQPVEGRDPLMDVNEPRSPIDMLLQSPVVPRDNLAPSSSFSNHSSMDLDSPSTTCPQSIIKISHSPKSLIENLKDPDGGLGATPPDIAQGLFPTSSTSSSLDSGFPSPRTVELPYVSISNPVNSDVLDLSSVRRKETRGRKPKGQEKYGKNSPPLDVQLIFDLPQVTGEASKTFEILDRNWYQFKGLGKTKMQEDSMVCDCSWSPGDDPQVACSQESGCINYLTQVECLEEECRCRKMCQNQRFQKKQYARIQIVQTEKKGYGMRLEEDVKADSFIYEYIGEVVGEKAFQRRIKEYAAEGLKHFYFMQLQREEYIDATKKGGLGRFLNHSCNPNCQIGKWVVGRQVRMGIFTKRAVKAGEELTFNYNVDRYGYDAQECYCGEPNCVGFLGGKTQTDVGAMDDLYIDALGIKADVEAFGLKGSKTKRSKKIDIDYMPIMKCISLKDVPKVASAIRQSISNQRILSKLLRRILITDDPAVQKQLMRLHGFSMMSMVLNEYLEDQDIVKTTLEILLKWPLMAKNKLTSTNIEETVMKLKSCPSEAIQVLALELENLWADLSVAYRIPKAKDADDAEVGKRKSENIVDQLFSKRSRRRESCNNSPHLQMVSEVQFVRPEAAKRIKPEDRKPEDILLPQNWAFERTLENRVYFYHVFTRQTQWTAPTAADVAKEEQQIAEFYARQKAAAMDVDDIVAKTKAEAEAAQKQAEAQRLFEQAEQQSLQNLDPRRKVKNIQGNPSSKEGSRGHASGSNSGSNGQDATRTKDKKMLRLFSNVIVRTMSRYNDSFEHDQFKKRAKELTDILCQKEAKSSNYRTDNYDRLTPEKEVKIKNFVKDWVSKLLARKGLVVSTSGSGVSQPAEIGSQKSASPPLQHQHGAPAAPEFSPQASAAGSTSHVPYAPLTPGSQSISGFSNSGHDVDGGQSTREFESAALVKPIEFNTSRAAFRNQAELSGPIPEPLASSSSSMATGPLVSDACVPCVPLHLVLPPPPPPPGPSPEYEVDSSRRASLEDQTEKHMHTVRDGEVPTNGGERTGSLHRAVVGTAMEKESETSQATPHNVAKTPHNPHLISSAPSDQPAFNANIPCSLLDVIPPLPPHSRPCALQLKDSEIEQTRIISQTDHLGQQTTIVEDSRDPSPTRLLASTDHSVDCEVVQSRISPQAQADELSQQTNASQDSKPGPMSVLQPKDYLMDRNQISPCSNKLCKQADTFSDSDLARVHLGFSRQCLVHRSMSITALAPETIPQNYVHGAGASKTLPRLKNEPRALSSTPSNSP